MSEASVNEDMMFIEIYNQFSKLPLETVKEKLNKFVTKESLKALYLDLSKTTIVEAKKKTSKKKEKKEKEELQKELEKEESLNKLSEEKIEKDIQVLRIYEQQWKKELMQTSPNIVNYVVTYGYDSISSINDIKDPLLQGKIENHFLIFKAEAQYNNHESLGLRNANQLGGCIARAYEEIENFNKKQGTSASYDPFDYIRTLGKLIKKSKNY
jgi:hypothetical protein